MGQKIADEAEQERWWSRVRPSAASRPDAVVKDVEMRGMRWRCFARRHLRPRRARAFAVEVHHCSPTEAFGNPDVLVKPC